MFPGAFASGVSGRVITDPAFSNILASQIVCLHAFHHC